MSMRTSTSGKNFIKGFEAYRQFAYPDPGSALAKATRSMRLRWGFRPAREILQTLDAEIRQLSGKPWTVGYGETREITMDSTMTLMEAETTFEVGLREFEDGVWKACTRRPNQNEFDAMVSLAYNIGLGWEGTVKPKNAKDGFRQSTVLKAHNRGDAPAAARAFGLWNRTGGQESNGLTRRRNAEGATYLKPLAGAAPQQESEELPDMPQNVEAERPMTSSSINRTATIAGGTAAISAAAEVTRTVGDIKYNISQLGDWILPVALVVIVGLCAYIVWERYNQRKKGWS